MPIRRFISALCSIVLSVSALAQLPDDTTTINNLIKATAAAGGGTVQLQPRIYYYRGTLQMNSDTGAINNVTIAGDPSGQTRIIAGIRILNSSWKTYSDIAANDPWKSRFPTSARANMRWVDLSAVVDRSKDVGIGAWPSGKVSDSTQAPNSIQHPAVVNLQGKTLQFADENDDAFPWRVSNGSLTDPRIATTAVPMTIQAGDPEMRCTAFTTQDYSPVQVGVENYSVGTGQVILKTSPFDTTGAYTKFSMKQRFRLWNGPEFLSLPGEMVLDTARLRIFFMPRTGSETELTVSSALLDTSNPTLTNADLMNIIGAKNITFRNLTFENLATQGIMLRYADGVTFDNVTFRGVGGKAIELSSCVNVSINNCSFYDAYRGFVTLSDVSPYLDPRNKRYSAFAKLLPNNVSVTNCRFERSGILFPQCRALALTSYNVGTLVESCTFLTNYGTSVGITGANNTVRNCSFSNCLRDITDAGCVYGGGSFIQIGNRVENCTFTNILRPLTIPASVQIDIAGVFIDNFGCGWQVVNNTFDTMLVGIKMNGGRFNLFDRNIFRNISLTAPNSFAIRITNRMGGTDLIQQAVDEYLALISRTDFAGFVPRALGDVNNWTTELQTGAYAFYPRYNDLNNFYVLSGVLPNTPIIGTTALLNAQWSYFTSAYKVYCYRNVGNLCFFAPGDFSPAALNPFKKLEAAPEDAGTPFPIRDVKTFLKTDGSDTSVWPNFGGVTGILVQGTNPE